MHIVPSEKEKIFYSKTMLSILRTSLKSNLLRKALFSTKPWKEPMSAGDFDLMCDILNAPR